MPTTTGTTKWYIYGLSANPPTKAHYEIIQTISTKGGDLTCVPSYKHPVKTNLIDFDHRVNMLRTMIGDSLPNVYVSEIERECRPRTTHELIMCLRSRMQLHETNESFVVVCDAEIMRDILNLNRRHSEELLRSEDIEFCVVLNNNSDNDDDRVSILTHMNSCDQTISFVTIRNTTRSTHFRNDTTNPETYLPQSVCDYIRENNIVFRV